MPGFSLTRLHVRQTTSVSGMLQNSENYLEGRIVQSGRSQCRARWPAEFSFPDRYVACASSPEMEV